MLQKQCAIKNVYIVIKRYNLVNKKIFEVPLWKKLQSIGF